MTSPEAIALCFAGALQMAAPQGALDIEDILGIGSDDTSLASAQYITDNGTSNVSIAAGIDNEQNIVAAAYSVIFTSATETDTVVQREMNTRINEDENIVVDRESYLSAFLKGHFTQVQSMGMSSGIVLAMEHTAIHETSGLNKTSAAEIEGTAEGIAEGIQSCLSPIHGLY